MLEEGNLTLAKAIDICHSMEATKAQLRIMTTRSEIDAVACAAKCRSLNNARF